MKVLVTSNRTAGSSDEEALDESLSILGRLGPVQEARVEASAQLEGVLDQVSDDDLVVVAGGDGSVGVTVNMLAARGRDPTLAILPMGTGNDLARSLALPLEPPAAARRIVEGRERSIDVGRARGEGVERLFVNACLGGFPVSVDEALDEAQKKRLGAIAFWMAGARALRELSSSTVSINDQVIPDCIAVGIGNGRSAGGGLEVWPQAELHDGSLDAVALPAKGVREAVAIGTKVLSGSHVAIAGVVTCRAPVLQVDSDPAIEINVDGELVGLRTPATFEVVSRLRVRA